VAIDVVQFHVVFRPDNQAGEADSPFVIRLSDAAEAPTKRAALVLSIVVDHDAELYLAILRKRVLLLVEDASGVACRGRNRNRNGRIVPPDFDKSGERSVFCTGIKYRGMEAA